MTNPASLNEENLQDFRPDLAAAADAPLQNQLALLQEVTAKLQEVLKQN